MGYGDEIMATGLARGAAARGKKIAFGDGQRIIWGRSAEQIFRNNPNIARASDTAADLEWVAHYPKHRAYGRFGPDRFIWNYEFRPRPGEIFFDAAEDEFAAKFAPSFVLVEPNVIGRKSWTVNKDWGVANYQAVVDRLVASGHIVVQLEYGGRHRLARTRIIATGSFRHALAILSRAALFIGPEGGMHHGAAALGVPGVVIFGGFIPPAVTGYDDHVNLTGGAEACGSLHSCSHCREAMDRIKPDAVFQSAMEILQRVRCIQNDASRYCSVA